MFAPGRGDERHGGPRANGIVPISGDLDRQQNLRTLAPVARGAGPFQGARDVRTANLRAALTRGGSLPQPTVEPGLMEAARSACPAEARVSGRAFAAIAQARRR